MAYTVASNAQEYYAGWSFEVVIDSVTINKLKATVNYSVYTRRNNTNYSERYNNWCKVYVGTWKNSISASGTPTHHKSVSGTGWGNGWDYDVKLFSSSKTVDLSTEEGKGSLRIVAVGAYGSTWTGQDGYWCYHDLTINITGGWTSIGTGTTTIKDNYNNTFTITATKGKKGTNNPAGGPTNLKWGYTSTGMSTTYTNGQIITLKISDNSKSTRTVYATSTTTAEHGDDMVATTSADVVQFIAPKADGKPTISFNKSRLTTKEDWTYEWNAATASNVRSSVQGYTVVLQRKQPTETSFSTIDTYDTTSRSITINPTQCGFNPGDQVRLGIQPFTRYGSKNTETKLPGSVVYSDPSTVQNSGVMRIKAGGKWHEGQVCVKVSGKWVEADVVKIKTANGWKDSE